MKEEMERRFERAKKRERKAADAPDVMVKVTCKYRAELFFKISRKTKLSRLFNVWTDRMEVAEENARTGGETRLDKLFPVANGPSPTGKDQEPETNGVGAKEDDTKTPKGRKEKKNGMQFLFTHLGRIVEPDQTPDDLGMESGDEVLAVEMMDLTLPNEAVGFLCLFPQTRTLTRPILQEDLIAPPEREKIKKHWTDKPSEYASWS